MTKIHLDTDIGGDMDDLCALAMILKWPDLEITGVTTVSDEQGRRAGYVQYVLSLVGSTDIPFAAGADVSGGYYRYELEYPPDEENWPEPMRPRPGSPDKALSLLKDIINFQHDPLACAIASGWHEGVEMETVPLKLETRESWLYEIPDSDGIPACIVTKIDGNAFNEYWCNILCR